MKAPKLYKKKDDAYYFTFNGKQHYAGKTLEKAGAKLKKITGAATCPQSCLVAVVGEYLDTIHGTQADDTVYQKALSYGALLTFLSGKQVSDYHNTHLVQNINPATESLAYADAYARSPLPPIFK